MEFNSFYLKMSKVLFFISIIYLSLFVPLMIVVYSASWYDYNYKTQEITKQIITTNKDNATNNLIGFFSYKNSLNDLWNQKEKTHMNDVRTIYLYLEIFAMICLILFLFTFDKTLIVKYSKYNLIVILALLVVLPFFAIFWNTIFHQTLFNNDFWLMNQNDISYYLFPIKFFRNSFLFIVFFAEFENVLLYFISKKYL